MSWPGRSFNYRVKHQLVTFLNRSLKDRGFIFGMTRGEKGGFVITIYDEPSIDYRRRKGNQQ